MRILFIAALLGAAAPLVAAPLSEPPQLPVLALTSPAPPVKIDGRLEEALWRQAPPFEAFQRFRPDSAPDAGPYRTEVRLLLTAEALVIGLRAWDPDPQQLRAPLARRDQVWPDQDSLTVWIDPTGRQQVAQFVRVNAAGVIHDGLYSAAADDEDTAPDFWEVEAAAHRLPDGYSVEIRWPLSALRYPLQGVLPWRVMVSRRVPREPALTFTSTALNREHPHLLAQMQTLSGLDEVLPERLARAEHRVLRSELTLRRGRPERASPQANLGLELQWRPRADWVLDATLRPDFSQVELDEPQLAGNTRFALFQAEKRSFFLESSEVLGHVMPDDWGVARGLLAFYSRTVADPRWGVRATWRGAQAEATALALHDAGGGQRWRPGPFGTEAEAVARASRALFARHRMQWHDDWALAGLVSVRDWQGGGQTRLLGLDFQGEPSEANQWRGHWLMSEDRTGPGASPSAHSERGHAAWVSWRHRGEGLRWHAHWEHISPRFVNDNGFVPQAGIERRTLEWVRPIHPESGPLVEWEWMVRLLDTRALRDPEHGVLQRQASAQAVQPGFWLLGPWDTGLWVHANEERQRAQAGGPLHRPRSWTLGFESHPGPRWHFAQADLTWGERVDVEADRVVRGLSLSSQFNWRTVLPTGWGLELEQRWALNHLQTPSGSEWALRERQSQTKLLLLLSPEQALRWVQQRGLGERRGEPGLAARQHRDRTTTFTWLARAGALRGWSLGLNLSRPALGAVQQRELFVKYQQGFAL
ncbi:DUF5916 domain-containing protein [Inhella gelatinilytica]|uniref:DUF5916 domain-containing protein n=1 Tax=Inhella gelatinilytica TaxID=2795030 RepID=A0A931IUY5_9BURK|nr:DUF5916 domain-containing protein [Inhella gelatinilytica]MBH9551475.1 hypothetical protein [Inhella gelatinilytica]